LYVHAIPEKPQATNLSAKEYSYTYQTRSSRQPKMGGRFAWQLIEIWTHYCKTKCRATMCYTGPGFL